LVGHDNLLRQSTFISGGIVGFDHYGVGTVHKFCCIYGKGGIDGFARQWPTIVASAFLARRYMSID
jgi:hypothetical protein